MRQVCYVCGIVYGFKEPYELNEDTHGLCMDCFKTELEKINALKSQKIIPRERELKGS